MNDLVNTEDNPLAEYKISPEIFEVATAYVQHLDTGKTAEALGIPRDVVVAIIGKPEVKRYIDAIFLEQGYLQRNKLADVMGDLIDMKIAEMAETEIGSSKDILDLLQFMHKMQQDHAKAAKDEVPGTQVNIQNNGIGGDNYSNLMKKIISGDAL